MLAERKIGKEEGLLHPIPKGERPFDTYYIDHLGFLSSTKKRIPLSLYNNKCIYKIHLAVFYKIKAHQK